MGRRIRKSTVIGVGTPPPLPVPPLVDEVLRAWMRSGRGRLDRARDRPTGQRTEHRRGQGSAIAGGTAPGYAC